MESSGHSRVWHVATAAVGLAGAHGSLSEALGGWGGIRGLSVRNGLLLGTLALGRIEVLLRHRSVAWLRLYISWWLVLLLLHLVLWGHILSLSDWGLAVSSWLHCHLICHWLIGE